LNGWIASRLARSGFIDQMGSSEGPVLALIRYIQQHRGDLLWFPMWQGGVPFSHVYQPGLHWTAAGIGDLFSLPPERAYHLLAAFVYAIGPVTLYLLCFRLTNSRTHAFLTGLLYSLFSPSGLFAAAVRGDIGGWFHARRYQVLVHYGEGPHLMALALIPLAIWGLDRALHDRRRVFTPVAAILLASVVLTNWTGTVGLTAAVVAYFASQFGSLPFARWVQALGIAVLGYLLICPWVPPSAIAAFPANAQYSVGVSLGGRRLLWLGGLIGLLGISHVAFTRAGVSRGLRFFVYFLFATAIVVLPADWANISVIPQPKRIHLEMEMALSALAMYPVARLWNRLGSPARIGLAVLIVLLSAAQFRTYRAYIREITRPIDVAKTIEYREAQWFEQNMPGKRVFAPGSVDMWMNAFTDVPQVLGCCDQGVPTLALRIAVYTVYTRDQQGDREGPNSALWLKAYGAAAVGVSGPHARESYRPYTNPGKFDGILPVLWRDGDDVIYGVTQGPYSLAHVIRSGEEVSRTPVHGLDVAPLQAYVAALEDPSRVPAKFEWRNQHEARIEAKLSTGELISVQVNNARGWRAEANGHLVPIRSDGLGWMIIDPACQGACTVDLLYDGGPERRWTRVAQWFAVLLCALLVVGSVFYPDYRAMRGRSR
jgi:hypothetical protein